MGHKGEAGSRTGWNTQPLMKGKDYNSKVTAVNIVFRINKRARNAAVAETRAPGARSFDHLMKTAKLKSPHRDCWREDCCVGGNIGSTGLDLKTDPGVPSVHAGFGALMLTTCISFLSHS
ncbi:hypothetical protein AAHA92_14809 [Salvia divinorum]|uniref:Uncharacterized protein n=1 Tax=Salvia divinorum TaxID=28513 RepID=A0ABD1HCQ9_SALDI